MSRQAKARAPVGGRHPYRDDPLAPGTCATCGRADPEQRNAAHQRDPAAEAAQEEHRRRAGDRDA